jgi:hypothetical protein
MDAAAQLALMAKAKLVFETPGNFLSFPALSPLTFKPAQLNFAAALGDLTVAAALEDFSRAVNRCPGNPIASADQDDYLWDHVDAWLNAMSMAASQSSAGDQTAYDAARALLVVAGPAGLDTDSPVLVAYKNCRDAVMNAQQALNAAQMTASAASDPAAQAAWTTTGAPPLQAALAAAQADWSTTGRKADVEAAQGTITRYEAQSPARQWANWRALYASPGDQLTNPASNARFTPSGFSPANIADQGWTTLTLSAAEIASLSAGAPAALRALFGNVGASGIGAVSFEFRSAAVVRPWMTSDMFSAKFWKFGDGTQICDGATPPGGSWPAYVAAVIFIRNVQVTQAGTAVQTPVRQIVLTPTHMPPPVMARPMPVATRPVMMRQPMMMQARVTAPPLTMAPHVQAAAPVFHPMPVAAMPPHQMAPAQPILRLTTATYPTPPTIPTTPTPPATPAQPDDTISILAFICRTLPKCPDPDPSLSW